jgi:hypothetical protein
MIFDYQHFENNMLPGGKLKCIQILERLDEVLKEILFNEIKEGNKIFDVTTGWPEPDSIIVQTRYAFKKKYKKEGTWYKEHNDPHYSQCEYSSENSSHLLVCPFKRKVLQ